MRSNFSRFRGQPPRLLRLCLLGIMVLFICIGLSSLPEKTLANNQSAWRYAAFPVENFQAYTSGFGYRVSPYNGKRQFHYGLDIAAPLGSYVRNWWSGRVIELSDGGGCGTRIKIQSGQWGHTYCHLMGTVEEAPQGRYLVDREGGIVLWQGQEVPLGARIGRVGMTGRTTGPHLHWELTYNNQHLDPALVLREMFREQASL